MILFLQRTRVVSAQTVAEGEFYCLYCGAERNYVRRAWQRTVYLFWIWGAGGQSGECVICRQCGSAYDPECLDENSTAELNELLVDPPVEVTDVAGLASRSGPGARTRRSRPDERLSGYSAGRRH